MQQSTMSKLTIFLCAVLFASAVNSSLVSDAIISAKQKVLDLVTLKINAAKERFDAMKNKAVELAVRLEAAATAKSDKVYEQIKSRLEKAQQDIDKLTSKDHGVDVTDCNKLVQHLDDTALAVIANMSSCVTKKLETGNEYVKSIVEVAENVLANLTSIREEARHCGDNVSDIKSAAGAILCTNLAAFKATWVATKTIPTLTIKMTQITYLLATLKPSLVYCTTTNGLVTFYRESSTIVERTKQCIQQKIHEIRPDTAEVEYTTETVVSPSTVSSPSTVTSESTTSTETATAPQDITDEIAEKA